MDEAMMMPGNPEIGPGGGPGLLVVGQFIKDLSFENPGASGAPTERPQIELGVDLQARNAEGGLYEVEMKLRVNAKTADERPLFLLELVYAGLFRLQNIPEDVIQQMLLIEAPHVMFPFVRRIVADVVRDGGMPPFLIEPIDFLSLYRAKMAQLQQERGGKN